MLILILLPFINFILLFFFGRLFGNIGAIYLTIFNLILLIFFALKTFFLIFSYNCFFFISLGYWFNIGDVHVE